MGANFKNKSTNEEIRQRFDNDVERFSNLETGQQSTIDAPISLELITDAAKAVNPMAVNLLDIGCGAGNYTIKMLTKLPGLHCTLVDLSKPMLDKACRRVRETTSGHIDAIQGDIRTVALAPGHYDIILAGAVLHHLRDDDDWRLAFKKIYSALREGGSFWISDLITHSSEEVNALFQDKYSAYLASIGGTGYRDRVLSYIEKEDSPRPLTFQLDLLKEVGFRHVEILHKNSCFAAFGGIR
ncbi:class I SAM-dependent methyltransferase [Pontibacter diazotrophicus]|uniref:Class I SAM-dependent methyltransferase n=1 Tax=Pontibacter diazotrophicus TaxID=1400979 RepID=A0A3D8LBE1_9BACT|nr:class I SAM-dependent methyltransferase [Pontibacter diazotrophicus]RDV14614.1 class I SAM-dependent methyltransferase [Pontibacter diazotrophicus]